MMLPKKKYSKTIENLKLKINSFRNTHIIELKDFEIAEKIGWKRDKFSKSMNGYTEGALIQLRDAFIEHFNADPSYFEEDTVANLEQCEQRYLQLEENFKIQSELIQAERDLHEAETRLHYLRLEKLTTFAQTSTFQNALKNGTEKDVLRTICRIFALEVD